MEASKPRGEQPEHASNNAIRSLNPVIAGQTAPGSSTTSCTIVGGDGPTVMDQQREQNEQLKSNQLERSRVPALQLLEDGQVEAASAMVAARAIQRSLIYECAGRVARLGSDNSSDADASAPALVAFEHVGVLDDIKINPKWIHMIGYGLT